jgi:hypothetical protein
VVTGRDDGRTVVRNCVCAPRNDDGVSLGALTAFVAFEKLIPLGVAGARISGALLIAAGIWMLAR